MKRLISLLLSIVLVLGIASCGLQSTKSTLPSSDLNVTNPDSSPSEEETSKISDAYSESNNVFAETDISTDSSLDTTNEFDVADEVSTAENISANFTASEPDIPVAPEKVIDAIYTYGYDDGSKYNREVRLNNTLKKLYWDGIWDGNICSWLKHSYESYTVEINKYGYIELNGSSIPNNVKATVDLPLWFESDFGTIDSCNIEYVPGDGTYVIIEETFMKFVKGEQVPLKGKDLHWKELEGADTEYGHAILWYSKACDRMFLSVPMEYKYTNTSNGVNIDTDFGYLYIFKDYKNSKNVEFVSRMKYFYEDETGFFFTDPDGSIWKYCGNGNSYHFEKVEN